MKPTEEKRKYLERNVNIDQATVAGFGDEWSHFTQDQLGTAAREQIFQDYFAVFPWDRLSPDAVGADVGCGSGRWAQVVAPPSWAARSDRRQSGCAGGRSSQSERRTQCRIPPRFGWCPADGKRFIGFCLFAGGTAPRAGHGRRDPFFGS